MIGKRFGRLVVLERVGTYDGHRSVYKVRCDCGTEFECLAQNLKSGATKSCGCLRREIVIKRNANRKRRDV